MGDGVGNTPMRAIHSRPAALFLPQRFMILCALPSEVICEAEPGKEGEASAQSTGRRYKAKVGSDVISEEASAERDYRSISTAWNPVLGDELHAVGCAEFATNDQDRTITESCPCKTFADTECERVIVGAKCADTV